MCPSKDGASRSVCLSWVSSPSAVVWVFPSTSITGAAGRHADRRRLSLLSDTSNNCTRLRAHGRKPHPPKTHASACRIHVTAETGDWTGIRANLRACACTLKCTCVHKSFKIDKCVSKQQMDLSESNDTFVSHRHSNECQQMFRFMFLQHVLEIDWISHLNFVCFWLSLFPLFSFQFHYDFIINIYQTISVYCIAHMKKKNLSIYINMLKFCLFRINLTFESNFCFFQIPYANIIRKEKISSHLNK